MNESSLFEKVESIQEIKEKFKILEKLAEDVISLRNEVIGLSKKKEITREGFRAIQKQTQTTAWISMG